MSIHRGQVRAQSKNTHPDPHAHATRSVEHHAFMRRDESNINSTDDMQVSHGQPCPSAPGPGFEAKPEDGVLLL